MDTDLIALAAQSPVALWLLAVGFFSPPVISVIQQSRFGPRLQAIIAFVFYLLVSAVTVWLNGIFSATSLIVALLVVFVTGATAYRNLWKPTGIAPKIQAATPIGSTGPLG